MKTEKFSAENKWRQTQLNEKNGEIWKKQIKKIFCKIQSPWPIGVPHDYFMVDRFQVAWLVRHYKTYANKKGQWADISSSN
jgi:hypothetical protein